MSIEETEIDEMVSKIKACVMEVSKSKIPEKDFIRIFSLGWELRNQKSLEPVIFGKLIHKSFMKGD